MKLMVCGSRTIVDSEWIFGQIESLLAEKNIDKKDLVVVDGGAKGVDLYAALFCSQIHEPVGIQFLTVDEDFMSVSYTSFVQNENGIDNKNFALTEYFDCIFEDVEFGEITITEAKKFNAEHRTWLMNCLEEPETEFGEKLGKCARIKL